MEQSPPTPRGGNVRNSPPKGREPLKYVLRLSGFETLKDEAYTVYFIRVSIESRVLEDANAKRMWYIRKRYSDFYNLRQGIIGVNGVAPDLPQKKYFGNCDPEFIKLRAHKLSKFIWELAANPHLCAIKCVHEFLWSDVCKPPTKSLLPSTPVISTAQISSVGTDNSGGVFGGMNSSTSLAAIGELSLEGETHLHERELHEAELVQQAKSEIEDLQGCMLLTSCEDLQRAFASEGILFPEDDVVQSDGNDSEFDDPNFLVKACSSFMPGLYKWYTGGKNNNDSNINNQGQLDGNGKRRVKPPDGDGLDRQRLHTLDNVEFMQQSVQDDDELRKQLVPKLRFVIILVGSRGDVQPYVALGIALQRRGHYVRIAAHDCFREFVTEYGLGFAPLAGDPKELLRMVTENNMFSFEFVKQGLTTHRTWITHLLDDAWDACTLEEQDLRQEPEEPNTDRPRRRRSKRNIGDGPGFAFAARRSTAFRADAVICNPPAFAGWHVAEALGVPLYMSFPMPWSRTVAFPSPFTSAREGNPQLNWMSYGAVDRLMWLGAGDLINRWRVDTLRLPPIWTMSARGHRMIHDNKVPFIYPWSPQILPKPDDWGSHICIPGYWFLDDEVQQSEEAYQPPEPLDRFLKSGEPPIFIGFGSIVVTNPNKLSDIIIKTVAGMAKTHRFLVQSGWSNIDITTIMSEYSPEVSKQVLQIGAVPHRWLFQRCKLVVHHGGAGTTAEGLRAGKPSVVIPFFGDQFFWAKTVKDVRIGTTVPYTKLSTKKFIVAIENALGSGVRMRAQVLGASVSKERGTDVAIAFIERQFLKLDMIRGMEAKPLPMPANTRRRPYSESFAEPLSSLQVWTMKNIAEEDCWRFWPYVDWGDKAVDKSIIAKPFNALYSIGRRVKVVGKVLKHSVSSNPMPKKLSTSEDSSVELSQFSIVNTPKNAQKFPPKSFPKQPPPRGHTWFSWYGILNHETENTFVGHTNFSLKANMS